MTADSQTAKKDILQAETALLGAILLDERVLSKVRDVVSAEMFWEPRHGWIYDALIAVHDRGQAIDHVLLGQELIVRDQLAKIGGAVALKDLTDAAGLVVNASEYAKIVRREHCRRSLARVCREIYETGKDPVEDVEGWIARSRRRVAEVANGLYAASRLLGMAQATALAHDRALSSAEILMPTGFSGFDSYWGGLPPTYIVLGGYPGSGKSTFLTNLVANVAVNGKHVLFLSMEDSRDIVLWRMFSRFGRVNSKRIFQRKLDAEEIRNIGDAANIVHKLPITIDDSAGRTGAEMRDTIERVNEEHKIDLIVIDRMEMVRERGKDLYHQKSAVSSLLADIQRQYEIPLVVVCQLSRPQADTATVKAPTIRQLRDSGNIEADARMIIMLHRPHYYWEIKVTKDEPDPHELGVLVEKNNYGITGSNQLWIDLEHAYIGDIPNDRVYPDTVLGGTDDY